MRKYIFLYGTLKKNFNSQIHKTVEPYLKFTGYGTIEGVLYNIGKYPGAVLGKEHRDSKIYGEIYEIDSSKKDFVLEKLDDFEECSHNYPEPHEYKRVSTVVTLDNETKISAWVYKYNLSTESLQIIESGKFDI